MVSSTIIRRVPVPERLRSLLSAAVFSTPPPPSKPTCRRLICSVTISGDVASTSSILHQQSLCKVQNILSNYNDGDSDLLRRTLDQCHLPLSDELVLSILRRYRSHWKPALLFFHWASRGVDEETEFEGGVYSPGPCVYHEILDVLGRMRRFGDADEVLDKMRARNGAISERAFLVVLNRYAAAHRVDDAITFLYKRTQYGLRLDSMAFRGLLLCLCRYKHVETAEFLFRSKEDEFPPDIKAMNVVLNGWCVRRRVREAKRFWNDIISSKCKPDLFTYGTFINALVKAGKLGSAMELFTGMWRKGMDPDVAICNCIIDALCFKKRIKEALDVFGEMNERECMPDTATYNSLIKHLCVIGRLDKVEELLREMEEKKGCCSPTSRTYGYLLKCMADVGGVRGVLERMESNGCKMNGDICNLVLKMHMMWGDMGGVESAWVEMERSGLGPDQRSFTIMVHGMFEQGRNDEGLRYYGEMISRGMIPEPRTDLLAKAMQMKLEGEVSGTRELVKKKRKKNPRSDVPYCDQNIKAEDCKHTHKLFHSRRYLSFLGRGGEDKTWLVTKQI